MPGLTNPYPVSFFRKTLYQEISDAFPRPCFGIAHGKTTFIVANPLRSFGFCSLKKLVEVGFRPRGGPCVNIFHRFSLLDRAGNHGKDLPATPTYRYNRRRSIDRMVQKERL